MSPPNEAIIGRQKYKRTIWAVAMFFNNEFKRMGNLRPIPCGALN